MAAIGSPNRWVNPDATGGTYNGLTQATAWLSVKDITGVSAGDAIACKYDASDDVLTTGNVLSSDGSAGARITIYSADFADDSWRAGYMIDGDSSVASAFTGTGTYWWFDGLGFKNFTGIAINMSAADITSINRCLFMSNAGGDVDLDNGPSYNNNTSINCGGTAFNSDTDVMCDNNYILNPSAYGILSGRGSATNNVIDGSGDYAIQFTSGAIPSMISNNIIYGCADGIYAGNYLNQVIMNLFHTITGTALDGSSNSQIFENLNVYYSNGTNRSATPMIINGGDSVDTVTNPLTDPANKDYSRAASSTDVKGTARRPGADWDTTIQSETYVTAGLPPEYSAGGGCFIQQSNSARLGVRES